MTQKKNVLISGASFAGLTTAYWMNRVGYNVTIVELAGGLKTGGTPVDIKGRTVDIIKRLGLYEQIKAQRIRPEEWEIKNADDITEHAFALKEAEDEFEIERDVLLHMLFELIRKDVTVCFNNRITSLQEREKYVEVAFKDGSVNEFDLVLGCDGVHSSVRKIWFGDESEYVHLMGPYFSIAIADRLLVKEGSYQMYNEPNKFLSLYAYNKKTDIIFIFRPEKEIVYDYRNQEQLRQLVSEQMEGMKWRAKELKKELLNSKSFYFDRFCQVKMPSWTKGRVALVGDAAYCASPAAGMGGSLAIIGATALGEAFEKHNANFEFAFREYNAILRPFIGEVQATAVEMLGKLLPEAGSKQLLNIFDK